MKATKTMKAMKATQSKKTMKAMKATQSKKTMKAMKAVRAMKAMKTTNSAMQPSYVHKNVELDFELLRPEKSAILREYINSVHRLRPIMHPTE